MAQLCINVPDNKVADVVDAFCEQHGYTEMIYNPATGSHDLPNPQTKNEFVRVMMKQHLIQSYVRKMADAAQASTANSAMQGL